MNRARLSTGMLALVLCLGAPAASATTILFAVENVAGNTWKYSYEVVNDTLAQEIRDFEISFDAALYENLLGEQAPAGWDVHMSPPDPGAPFDGIYNAVAQAGGIAPGQSLSGFSIFFDYLGPGEPGAQPFLVFEPITNRVLDDGLTTPAAQAPSVPEPGAALAFAAGAVVLAASGRMRARGPARAGR